jgi:(1->4)-alpha-D-glucan 1-alpha-D-glucosylmutase
MPTKDFHARMQGRVTNSPHGMTSTATHDTKRGEDARTRLIALSEFAGEWTGLVGRWKTMNASHVLSTGDLRTPSVAFEYMLYQAAIGAWPTAIDEPFVGRMKAYAIKAAREAKLETSWLNPNLRYEAGIESFLEDILDPSKSAEFITSIQSFANRVSLIGALNSLSQITLKAMMPGVPDFYQGTEFWDYSLVDPDNRRSVDFARRQAALGDSECPHWKALTQSWQDGRLKQAWTRTLLQLRYDFPKVFTLGDYRPLPVVGPDKDHVIAFARTYRDDAVIAAVGKRFADLTQQGRAWPIDTFDAALDLTGFAAQNLAQDGRLQLQRLFVDFPAAAFHIAVGEKNSRHKQSREDGYEKASSRLPSGGRADPKVSSLQPHDDPSDRG